MVEHRTQIYSAKRHIKNTHETITHILYSQTENAASSYEHSYKTVKIYHSSQKYSMIQWTNNRLHID